MKLFQRLHKKTRILKYLTNSCFTMLVDSCVVFLLNLVFHVNLVLSNTIGVFTGFVIGYFLTARFIFLKAKGKMGFAVYFMTFLLGLAFADFLIDVGNRFIFSGFNVNINVIFSKGLSVVLPFFALYGLRSGLYYLLGERNVQA